MNIRQQYTNDYDHLFKFKIIGDSGVGKSCLLLRYVDNSYTESYINNIGVDFKTRIIDLDNKTIKLQIWDTERKEARAMNVNNYSGLHAGIVAFSLTNQASFDNLGQLLSDFERHAPEDTPVILVGTQCDAERVVTKKAIESFMMKHNIRTYVETSAKTGENVELVFQKAARRVVFESKQAAIRREVALLSDKNDPRAILIKELTAYIARIEAHKNPRAADKPDFAFGFWHHKNSRSVNREATYHLVKDELLHKLVHTHDSIESIFDDLDKKRQAIIANKKLFERADYTNRGMNSDEVTRIIDKARAFAQKESSEEQKGILHNVKLR